MEYKLCTVATFIFICQCLLGGYPIVSPPEQDSWPYGVYRLENTVYGGQRALRVAYNYIGQASHKTAWFSQPGELGIHGSRG